jgi:hypothetical protein
MNYLEVGGAGTGELEVKDGGFVHSGIIHVAGQPGVTGSITVSGVNMNGEASRISVLYLGVGQGGVGELTIANGGFVEVGNGASGDAVLSELTGRGTVTVSGINAAANLPSELTVHGNLEVGSLRAGSLVIEAAGQVESKTGTVNSPIPSTTSEVRIVGNASAWVVDDQVQVGLATSLGSSIVTLVDGRLEAGSVEVGMNGTIRGFGTLVVDPANRITNSGGTISPGLSPGTLTINGSYEQQAGGRLLIEMAGTNSADYDHLIITNTATLGGTLELRFINGFAPKQGDKFNFLHVGGIMSNGFANVEVKNLAPGFQFNVSTNGTNISLVASNDGTFATPLQGQIASSNVVTIGGISYLPYTLNFTNPCSIVELAGPVTRQGQELFQTLSERSDPGCTGTNANASRILVLGALPPGSYQFHFMSDGVVVYSVSFDVSQNTGQVLSFTRTAGGELDLQINGLAGVRYTMQASADLKEWFDLSAHVGDFLGPYHVFEPTSTGATARFYRVKIE